MSEQEKVESIGRIEIAPEVLTTIVQNTTLGVDGVNSLTAVPADMSRLFRRAVRSNGVLLNYHDNNLTFDIYVLMEPHVNVLDTSRAVQEAVLESIDKMVGIPVDEINVHVEDVVYELNETA